MILSVSFRRDASCLSRPRRHLWRAGGPAAGGAGGPEGRGVCAPAGHPGRGAGPGQRQLRCGGGAGGELGGGWRARLPGRPLGTSRAGDHPRPGAADSPCPAGQRRLGWGERGALPPPGPGPVQPVAGRASAPCPAVAHQFHGRGGQDGGGQPLPGGGGLPPGRPGAWPAGAGLPDQRRGRQLHPLSAAAPGSAPGQWCGGQPGLFPALQPARSPAGGPGLFRPPWAEHEPDRIAALQAGDGGIHFLCGPGRRAGPAAGSTGSLEEALGELRPLCEHLALFGTYPLTNMV